MLKYFYFVDFVKRFCRFKKNCSCFSFLLNPSRNLVIFYITSIVLFFFLLSWSWRIDYKSEVSTCWNLVLALVLLPNTLYFLFSLSLCPCLAYLQLLHMFFLFYSLKYLCFVGMTFSSIMLFMVSSSFIHSLHFSLFSIICFYLIFYSNQCIGGDQILIIILFSKHSIVCHFPALLITRGKLGPRTDYFFFYVLFDK